MSKYAQTSLFNSVQVDKLSAGFNVHDLFIDIVPMTTEEFTSTEGKLSVNYSFFDSLFGEIIIASTSKGVCYMGFSDDKEFEFSVLEGRFPMACLIQQTDDFQENACMIFNSNMNKKNKIKLHIYGTDFQLKVWKELLKIQQGSLTTYGDLAKQIQQPKASRAVGTAIGCNPIAYIIPCHRVIQQSGKLGGYRWGLARKRSIINWEANPV